MHWSKTRQVQYENCPRQFFYESIAAPLNPKIDALRNRLSPPLLRHEVIRDAVMTVVRTPDWTVAQLPVLLAQGKAKMVAALGNEADANAEMSIVDVCINGFLAEYRPTLENARVAYITNGEPVEFIYDGLQIVAAPELAIDRDDRLDIVQFKSGSPDFANRRDHDLRLRASGLTCWARCALQELEKPVHVTDIYLRSRPLQTRTMVLDDQQVRDFVGSARELLPRFGVSARIADFPASPSVNACRFCSYKPICPEYGAYSEPSYDLEALAAAVDAVADAKVVALERTGGELRQVFLSHVSGDKEDYVRPFARALETAGISYWFDEAELMWGDSLAGGINNGLATSDYVITFISPQFLERGWTSAELNSSIVAHVKGKKRVLPITIGDREQIVNDYPMLGDIIGRNWEVGIETLVRDLQRVLAKGIERS